MSPPPTPPLVLDILDVARIIHEANRAVQRTTGEEVNPSWEAAPDWMVESTLQGIQGVLEGNAPEQSHESWMAARLADGWVYGPEKDVARKIHPCLVPYDELPPEQQLKDRLFVAIVRACIAP